MASGNNALQLKRTLHPRDYARDEHCTFINPTTGKRLVIPVEVIVALRAGKLEKIK